MTRSDLSSNCVDFLNSYPVFKNIDELPPMNVPSLILKFDSLMNEHDLNAAEKVELLSFLKDQVLLEIQTAVAEFDMLISKEIGALKKLNA